MLLMNGFGIATLPWMLALCRYRRTVFVHTGSVRCVFTSAVIADAVVFRFRATILVNVLTSLSDNFRFPLQLLLLEVVRPSCSYAHITLDTVARETSQSVAVLDTDAPARRAPTICPLLKSDMSPIIPLYSYDLTFISKPLLQE